jgi:hypothetical protein
MSPFLGSRLEKSAAAHVSLAHLALRRAARKGAGFVVQNALARI